MTAASVLDTMLSAMQWALPCLPKSTHALVVEYLATFRSRRYFAVLLDDPSTGVWSESLRKVAQERWMHQEPGCVMWLCLRTIGPEIHVCSFYSRAQTDVAFRAALSAEDRARMRYLG